MATEWKIGDQVQLKSGGPVMTVQEKMTSSPSYRCQWFAGKKLESGVFPSESLRAAAPPPPPSKPAE
jgi:uncharacterized protein YodC (DUF2158 family)